MKLALDAEVVVRGLTGMVTVDSDQCQIIDEDAAICLDGTSTPDLIEDCADGDCKIDYGDGAPPTADAPPWDYDGGADYDGWDDGVEIGASGGALSGFVVVNIATLLFAWMAMNMVI